MPRLRQVVYADRAGLAALQAIVCAEGQQAEGRVMMPRRLTRRQKANLAFARSTGKEYLFSMPKAVPAGHLLVHNHVRPSRRIGLNGFRIWLATQVDAPPLVLCDCDWAPELGPHFRVAFSAQRGGSNRLQGSRPERENGG
jgi:hypothetical protein